MRGIIVITLSLVLAACGAEMLGSAATGAATKAEEIRQGQKTQEQVKQRLDAANQAAEQQLRDAEKAANP